MGHLQRGAAQPLSRGIAQDTRLHKRMLTMLTLLAVA